MEVNDSKDLVLIGTEKHVVMINCNLNNRDFSLPKNIVETNDSINQIKLMHKPKTTIEILIVVDNSGQIVVTTLDKIKNRENKTKLEKYEVIKTQKYNSKINFNDNSPWSVDCQYPYIIIGSNNRTVFVFNYEEEEKDIENKNENSNLNAGEEISNSFIYKGNNNNIPYVTISGNGAFIGNNSIDKNFKIFDFFTGEMICSCQNPNNEWGWGIKFIPKDLFRTINCKFNSYEDRKFMNVSNEALNRANMIDSNLSNPSEYDEDKFNQVKFEDLNEQQKYIKLNLIDKYYILSTTNHCAGLFKLDFEIKQNTNEKIVVPIRLGKIELTRIFIRDSFANKEQIDYGSFLMIKGIQQCSRYEFIFISENMNLFLLGSKAGDLHIFEMNLYHDKDSKMIGVEDEPNILINFREKVAGMKFIENKGDNGKKVIDIFVLTLSGMFYYYRILPYKKFWNHFDENEIITK